VDEENQQTSSFLDFLYGNLALQRVIPERFFFKRSRDGFVCTSVSGTFNSFVGENSISILYNRKYITGLVPKPE
jgi:hypothetical protein